MSSGNVQFVLFNGLKEEAYGLLPLANLVSKGGPSTVKGYEKLASYNWYMADQDKPTIVVPGHPKALIYWQGGLLQIDKGMLIYDINHMKTPEGPLDSLIIAANYYTEKTKKQPLDFQQFDFITDSVNLQKLFAFCKGDGEGLFRIDFERIGNAILMTRVENNDVISLADHEAFDQNFKMKTTGVQTPATDGPFFQLGKYKFGNFNFLVRYEADSIDLGGTMDEDVDQSEPEKQKSEIHDRLSVIDHGVMKKNNDLMIMTAYPAGAGFPAFTWAQLFFTGCDRLCVGWFKQHKGRNDFQKPAMYHIADINKLIKPLPYAVLSKVHDCLSKVSSFLRQNHESVRVALVWKGADFLEIYEKEEDCPSAVSAPVHAFLKSQDKSATAGDPDVIKEEEEESEDREKTPVAEAE